jgi:EpsI family protein
MFAGSALGFGMRPRKHMADELGMPDLEAMFPKQFGPWREDTRVPVILPSPDVQALLDKIYNQVLSRTYVNAEGQQIMLSVAYGGDQSDGTSAHRPEVCYPAQGFVITDNRLTSLQIGRRQLPVRQLIGKLGPRVEPITYWVVVGGEVVTTGIGQKLAQMRYGLRGVIADGMLIRVSNIDANSSQAFRIQARFVVDMLQAMSAVNRARAVGT